MSLYALVHGMNPAADIILATLGLTRESVGRFRDAFVSQGVDSYEIAVYTRNGGGNRDDYEDVFEALRAHPLYDRDVDDDFDSTYATIYFKLPEEYADSLKKLGDGKFEPDKRWQDALEKLQKGDPTLIAKFKPLMEALTKALLGEP